jgi:hypothetical protein
MRIAIRLWSRTRRPVLKKSMALFICVLISPMILTAQQGWSPALATSMGVGASIDYPMEWSIVRVDLPGMYLATLSPSPLDQSDPFEMPDFADLSESGEPFAIAAFADAENAESLGFAGAFEGLAAVDSGIIKAEETVICGLPGKIYVADSAEGSSTFYLAIATTESGGQIAFFLGICPSGDADRYLDLFSRMHASFRIAGAAEQADPAGFTRVTSGGLAIDRPNGWNSHIVESSLFNVAMFAKGKLGFQAFEDLDPDAMADVFPLAIVISGTGDSIFSGDDIDVQEALDQMIPSLGTVDKVISKTQVTLAGMSGQRMIANISLDTSGGRKKAGV